jgi:hypothetical protein
MEDDNISVMMSGGFKLMEQRKINVDDEGNITEVITKK